MRDNCIYSMMLKLDKKYQYYNMLRIMLLVVAGCYGGLAHAAPNEDALQAYQQADYARAFNIWMHEAKQEDADAQYQLAELFRKGHGTQRNLQQAFLWYLRSAGQGHKDAQYNLARAYRNRQGTEKDESQAAYWYLQAAEQGHAAAQYNLGVLRENGWGTERDLDIARQWYEKAAAQGYNLAEKRLAQFGKSNTLKTGNQYDKRVELKGIDPYKALKLALIDGQTQKATQLLKSNKLDSEKSLDELGNTSLLLASRYGLTTVVQTLLDQGASPAHINQLKETALYVASSHGHYDIVRVLLDREDTSLVADASGKTALIMAARNGHASLIPLLLKHDELVSQRDKRGWTALTHAIRKKHSGVIQQLLQTGFPSNNVDKSGVSDLQHAVANFDQRILKLMFKFKANADEKDTDRNSLLHLAAKLENTAAVQLLIKHGLNADAQNHTGRTAIMIAAEASNAQLLAELLKHSEAPEKEDQFGDSALSVAVNAGCKQCVSLLIKAGAPLALSNHSRSLLMEAIQKKHKQITFHLLSNNIDVNTRNKQGETALALAAGAGWLDVARMILARKAEVNHTTYAGLTALDYAINQDQKEVERYLISAGGISTGSLIVHAQPKTRVEGKTTKLSWNDVQSAAWQGKNRELTSLLKTKKYLIDKENEAGDSPLILATKKSHLKSVALLLKSGANISHKNASGNTALHIAARNDERKIAEALLNHSHVSLSQQDKLGRTPAMVAIAHNNIELATLLLRRKTDLNLKDARGNTVISYLVKSEMFELTAGIIKRNRHKFATDTQAGRLLLDTTNAKNLPLLEYLSTSLFDLSDLDAVHSELLFSAIKSGSFEVYGVIIRSGVPVDVRDKDNNSALHIAALSGNSRIAKDLIERKVNINAENNVRDTPLLIATRQRHYDLISLLLVNGADPAIKNRLGETVKELSGRLKDSKIDRLIR